MTLEKLGDGILRRSPINWVKHRRREHVAVLAYHGVHDARAFESQLSHLEARASVVSLDDLRAALDGGLSLPERAALITFDDGDRSILEVASPLLHERGLRSAVFVITDLLNSNRPPWWIEVEEAVANGGRALGVREGDGRSVVCALKAVPDEQRRVIIEELKANASQPTSRHPQLTQDDLRELVSLGVEIGSHTASHPILPKCSAEVIERELTQSRAVIQSLVDQPEVAFAYPNGDEDPAVRHAVAAAGYDLAFGFDHRLAEMPPPDRFAISRVRVDSTTPINRFDIILSGLHPAIHHRVGRR